MTWSGTVDDAHKLGDKKRVVKETFTLTNGKTGTVIGSQERRNTITTETWVGISAAAANTFFGSNGTTAGLEDLSIEPMNDAGAYVIVKAVKTDGTWE